MSVIIHPPYTAATRGIMLITSIREVGECLVYWTSWLLCRPQGALTLWRSRAKRWRLSIAENTDLHTSCGNMRTGPVHLGMKNGAGLGNQCECNGFPTSGVRCLIASSFVILRTLIELYQCRNQNFKRKLRL